MTYICFTVIYTTNNMEEEEEEEEEEEVVVEGFLVRYTSPSPPSTRAHRGWRGVEEWQLLSASVVPSVSASPCSLSATLTPLYTHQQVQAKRAIASQQFAERGLFLEPGTGRPDTHGPGKVRQVYAEVPGSKHVFTPPI
ncbi:hypothetical protein E2C01_036977 [Portunus trituberculatus]|uniref:Uncharacterized protein n=1 Tax=Portunus trituberculatus TaxID=210409 RepID=A0A5B7FDX8_PORTR|nr:hypothetical protein [Portunus trituberculatus]